MAERMAAQHEAANLPTFRPIAWPESLRLVKTGDVGLYRPKPFNVKTLLERPRSVESWEIVRLTRKRYSHANMFGWKFGHAGALPRLMIGETVGHLNAHLIDAAGEVEAFAGCYDVFRVRPDCWYGGDPITSAEKAWDFMCHAAGSGYSWTYIWRCWVRCRLPKWLQWVCPPIRNSDRAESPRDCSGLVHAALRFAGGPQLSPHDCDVVPGDLADPRYLDYVATLFANEQQVKNFLFHQERLQ